MVASAAAEIPPLALLQISETSLIEVALYNSGSNGFLNLILGGKMEVTSTSADKVAIGLSLVCTVHCLLTPIAIVMLPALGATFLEDERFHYAILFLVLPISLLALALGCRKHRRFEVVITGLFGLLVLFLILILGEEIISESGEKTSTIFGTALIALAHIRNYNLCQSRSCHAKE